MNEQLFAALAAHDPSLKPLLSAVNGGGDISALLPLLMSMSGSKKPQNGGVVRLPDDAAINMTLKKLN